MPKEAQFNEAEATVAWLEIVMDGLQSLYEDIDQVDNPTSVDQRALIVEILKLLMKRKAIDVGHPVTNALWMGLNSWIAIVCEYPEDTDVHIRFLRLQAKLEGVMSDLKKTKKMIQEGKTLSDAAEELNHHVFQGVRNEL